MKTIVMIAVAFVAAGKPTADVDYRVDITSTGQVEVMARSNADNGIACAFVDLTVSVPVVGVSYGDDYGVLRGGDIDDEGVINFGGCTLAEGGAGLDGWSLVATAELDTTGAKRIRATASEPTSNALGTSLVGVGWADSVNYGKTARRPVK